MNIFLLYKNSSSLIKLYNHHELTFHKKNIKHRYCYICIKNNKNNEIFEKYLCIEVYFICRTVKRGSNINDANKTKTYY